MTNLTVRNIPDEIIDKIKTLSELDKRSLNNEILVILEKGLFTEVKTRKYLKISKETQINIWKKLSGLWEDKRSTKEIVDDIYSNRSNGREINL
jgi:plasmid stability protein